MSLNNDQIEDYKEIDKILWQKWDPIGINDCDEARDEYYSYLPGIFKLKAEQADQETLAQYLFKLETENMGLGGNLENCRLVAELILEI